MCNQVQFASRAFDRVPIEHVSLSARGISIEGSLLVPCCAKGVVAMLADPLAGSSARAVAAFVDAVTSAGFAALAVRFTSDADVHEAAPGGWPAYLERLAAVPLTVAQWLAEHRRTASLPRTCYAWGIAAAAAVTAAAADPSAFRAIVGRRARVDLVGRATRRGVAVPLLLVVTAHEQPLVDVQRDAMADFGPASRLIVLPGVPGGSGAAAIEMRVWELARAWMAAATAPLVAAETPPRATQRARAWIRAQALRAVAAVRTRLTHRPLAPAAATR